MPITAQVPGIGRSVPSLANHDMTATGLRADAGSVSARKHRRAHMRDATTYSGSTRILPERSPDAARPVAPLVPRIDDRR